MRIEAIGVTVRYGDQRALDGVDCAVRAGEMVALIGANGAGKTTLMRVLAGLQAPNAGEARYDGKTAHEFGRVPLARRVAFLAQGGAAQWPLRVDHLVALGRLPYRGERARALLARALAVEADILLADEPVAALDPLHQLSAMELLRAVAAKGAGVVVVLHDLTLAVRFCDRVIALAGGRIVADGPPSALTDAVVAEAYGVEVLRGEHRGEPFILPWKAIAAGSKSSSS
jgi:iron complex transport system ATP-binding protein